MEQLVAILLGSLSGLCYCEAKPLLSSLILECVLVRIRKVVVVQTDVDKIGGYDDRCVRKSGDEFMRSEDRWRGKVSCTGRFLSNNNAKVPEMLLRTLLAQYSEY